MKRRLFLSVLLVFVVSVALMAAAHAEAVNPTPISLDTDTYAVISNEGETCYYSFTPAVTAYYRFYSFFDDETDTYAYLYDYDDNGDLNELARDDDDGEERNFLITYKLTAGKQYIFRAEYLNTEATGTIPVRLEMLILLNAYADPESDNTVEYGSSATLIVQTETQGNNPTLTYQWKKTKPVEEDLGPGSKTFTVDQVTAYGQYACTVRDERGDEQTVWFDVYVNNQGLSIGQNQYDFTLTIGESTELVVTASGEGSDSLLYQWYKRNDYGKDELLEGETGTTLTVVHRNRNGENYYCHVTDQYGNPVTCWFYLYTTNGFSAYADNDSELSVSLGDSIDLVVYADCDSGNLTYEWYQGAAPDGTKIGCTESCLEIEDVTAEDRGPYYCQVSDDMGNTANVEFYLTVTGENNLEAEPAGDSDLSVAPNETATLEVDATCDVGQITYQWYHVVYDENDVYHEELIEGAAASAYTTGSITRVETYYCRVRDEFGNTEYAYFYISVDNGLTAEPGCREEQSVSPGSTVTLTVEASCTYGDLSYQWYKEEYNDVDGWEYVKIDGQTEDAIVTDPIVGSTAYYCRVSDQYGNKTEVYFYLYVERQFRVQPDGDSDFRVAPNTNVTMKVKATGSGASSLTYRWYQEDPASDDPIPLSSTGPTQTVKVTGRASYFCVVQDPYDNGEDVWFNVYIDNDIEYRAVPGYTQVINPGESATLEISASCSYGTLHYQWYVRDDQDDWPEIDGANLPRLELGPVDCSSEYYCSIWDDYGNDTESYTFRVIIDNGFFAEPVGSTTRSVLKGREACLQVSAGCDDGAVNYQWYNEDGEMLEGETGSAYVTEPVTGFARYSCRVSDKYNNNETITFTVKVRQSLADAPLLELDTPVEVWTYGTERAYFRFVPEETGTYAFYGSRMEDYYPDSFGEWVDQYGRVLESDDDNGGSAQFRLVCKLTAGETYYFAARHLDDSDTEPFYAKIVRTSGLASVWPEGAEPGRQWVDITVPYGGTATLKVHTSFTEEGDPPALTYTWYRYRPDDYGNEILEANTDTCQTAALTSAYYYHCTVEDENGNQGTATFCLYVDSGLTAEPVGGSTQEVFRGRSVTLSVNAHNRDGRTGMTYEWSDDEGEWYYDNTGAFTTGPITRERSYDCRVMDQYGSYAYVSFWLQPVDIIAAFEHDTPVTVLYGSTTTLKVKASCASGEQLTYQWYKFEDGDEDRTIIPGATGASYTTEAVTKSTYYSCDIADQSGHVRSIGCNVRISNGFSAVPVGEQERQVACGEPLDFEVRAECAGGDLEYQWSLYWFDGNNGNQEDIPGATQSSCHLDHAAHSPMYVICNVKDQYGNTISVWFFVETNDEGHTEVVDPEVQPTCTESGWTYGVHCGICGKVFLEREEIPANGHSWTRPVYLPSDDFTFVTASRHCTECDLPEETETVYMTGTKINASCETPEMMTYTSDPFENQAFVVQVYEFEGAAQATGHRWAEPQVTWSDDYSQATAVRVCRNDPSHIESETVDTDAEYNEPTCTDDGTITYTAVFEDDVFGVRTVTVPDENEPMLGHEWYETEYTPDYDNLTVTASRTCHRCNVTESEEAALTGRVTRPAGCDEAELTTFTSDPFENEAFEVQTFADIETADPLGHLWGRPSYVMSEDHSSATASHTCYRCGYEDFETTYDISSVSTSEATCDKAEVITYTAVFTDPEFPDYSETADGEPALGHIWDDPDYVPSEDFTTVTATHTCQRDPSHTESETVALASSYEEGSDCDTAGTITYSAAADAFTIPEFGPYVKPVQDRPAGHDWGQVEYTWTDNNHSVTARHTCRRCSKEESETVTTSTSVVGATCSAAGEATYTSSAFENPAFSVQTKKETIPILDHSWGEPAYALSNNKHTMTKTRVCTADPTHVDTETAPTVIDRSEPTCEENGQITYTATFSSGDHTETEVLNATGHNWLIKYAWTSDNSSVTATATCRNDGSHTVTETVAAASEVTTAPICIATGVMTYTAHFTQVPFTDQTKKTVIPEIGHNYEVTNIVWTDDYSSATATWTCKNNSDHTDTETVNAVVSTVQPVCDEPGQKTWHVEFTKFGYVDDAKTETIPASGQHKWNRPTYTVDLDTRTIKGVRTCQYNSSHRDEDTAAIVSENVTLEPTCQRKGKTTYISGNFTKAGFEPQTITLTNINKAPHDLIKHDEVIGDCEHQGNEAYWECDVCHQLFGDKDGKTPLNAPPVSYGGYHSPVEYHAAVAATANADGNIEYWKCLTCGRCFSDSACRTQVTSVTISKLSPPAGNHSDASANYTVNADGTATYKGPKKDTATVTIPATIKVGNFNVPVTKIADKAFKGKKKLKTVTIGSNIKQIGTSAFEGCKKLKTVKGGDNVEKIGDKAYKGCVALTKYTIGAKVNYIGKNAFNGCTKLKTITIKSTLLTSSNVKSGAFKKINAKATFKVPKAKKKEYAKFLPKKGTKTVKVK